MRLKNKGSLLKIRNLIGFFLALVVAVSSALAQVAPSQPSNPPQLKVELILSKKTFKVGETVEVRYRLTSLVDGTLCFAVPLVGAEQHYSGYLKTDASSPSGSIDLFLEHFWERHPGEESLRQNVLNQWIRLGMSEPYQTKKLQKWARLGDVGEWTLRSAYYPPALSTRDKEIVRSMGCTTPDRAIQADPVTITVVSSSD